MPQYFLNLNECGSHTIDNEGLELANVEAAVSTAVSAARDIMASEVLAGRLCLGCRIEVTEAAGVILATVPFRDAVQVTGMKERVN